MGLRSAAMCCQRLTNAMGYIMRSRGLDLVAYLDDMVTAEHWDQAGTCFSTLREIIASMGAVEAESKAVGPCTRMNFLGICFDTELLTMEVPQERVSECMGLLTEWLDKNEVTGKGVESLVGKLSFIAICVRPGRLFISRLLEYLRGLPKAGKVKVPGSVRKDLLWWRTFLRHYNDADISWHERILVHVGTNDVDNVLRSRRTRCPWCRWKDGLYRMKWWRQMRVWVVVGLGLILRESIFMPYSPKKSRCWIWV